MPFNYNAEISREVRREVLKLKALPKEVERKAGKKLFGRAAKPLVQAAKSNIKDGKHPPQKRGNATYTTGNLRKSIKVLPLRKVKNAVIVGARVARRASGVYGRGNRTNAYYAHMVEYGTVKFQGQRFMKRAFIATRAKVARTIVDGVSEVINNYTRRNGLR